MNAIDPRQLRDIARTTLTPRQFECWHLTRFHNRSYRTAALMLDVDESTVRRTVKRAEQKLDRRLRHNPGDGDVRATTLHRDSHGDRTGEGVAA